MTNLRTFALPAATTLILWVVVFVVGGGKALLVAAALTGLEVLLSFDNAAVNAKLLRFMSPRWQFLFMSVGILIAVFVVRFLLPIGIVSVTAGLAPGSVVDLALHQPDKYAAELVNARGAIDAFGGMFLFMIAANYFLDAAKDVHWLGPVERLLAKLGEREGIAALLAVGVAAWVAATAPGTSDDRLTVLVAALAGIGAHLALNVFGSGTPVPGKLLVGSAAVIMFLRLELLDASFSLDGVVAAFAFTDDVVIIAVCLGAGAMWVRSLTVHLLRSGVLDSPSARYLENGAFWTIMALAVVMLLGVHGIHAPEWVTSGAGLLIIGAALASSAYEKRKVALQQSEAQ